MIAVEQRSVDIHGNGLDGAQTHSLIGNGVLFYLDGAIHRASRLCILICLINYGNYLLFDYFDEPPSSLCLMTTSLSDPITTKTPSSNYEAKAVALLGLDSAYWLSIVGV